MGGDPQRPRDLPGGDTSRRVALRLLQLTEVMISTRSDLFKKCFPSVKANMRTDTASQSDAAFMSRGNNQHPSHWRDFIPLGLLHITNTNLVMVPSGFFFLNISPQTKHPAESRHHTTIKTRGYTNSYILSLLFPPAPSLIHKLTGRNMTFT